MVEVGYASETCYSTIDPSLRLEGSQNQTPPASAVSTLVPHLCSGTAGCGHTGTGTGARCLVFVFSVWLFLMTKTE